MAGTREGALKAWKTMRKQSNHVRGAKKAWITIRANKLKRRKAALKAWRTMRTR